MDLENSRKWEENFIGFWLKTTEKLLWNPFEVFETRCSLDATYFPFDRQICRITLVIWTHTVDEVAIEKSKDGFVYDEQFQENSVWKIESVSHEVARETRESRITFTFKLKRKPLYYVINIILPIIFLGLLNGLVFVIPFQSGEKTGYSVTVFLSLAVFLTIISSLLPTNSDNTSILGVYLLLQVVLGVIVLFVTTLQLRLGHRSSDIPVPVWYRKLAKFSTRIKCNPKCRRSVESTNNNDNDVKDLRKKHVEDEADDKVEWDDVASGLDFIFFWIFLLVYTIMTVTTFGHMITVFNEK